MFGDMANALIDGKKMCDASGLCGGANLSVVVDASRSTIDVRFYDGAKFLMAWSGPNAHQGKNAAPFPRYISLDHDSAFAILKALNQLTTERNAWPDFQQKAFAAGNYNVSYSEFTPMITVTIAVTHPPNISGCANTNKAFTISRPDGTMSESTLPC
jgi:hypothetical protein